jgi:DNA polymerase I-like protein with 3'-5' exonuclease and polymerase domains
MYPKTLAGHLRISVKEATELRKKFLYDAFPLIGELQNDIISVFESRGYVKSILGRKARLESRRFSYQGVSRVIQNSGGDHNKMCVLRACQYEDAHPDRIQILMPIHDSIIWQRDPGHSPKDFVAALENVANEFKLSVPIPFEVGSGANWSIASYGDKIKDKTGWRI